METRNEILKILENTDLFPWQKEEIVCLFGELWNRYYDKGIDTKFDTVELRDFWFYFKIIMLSKMVDWNNIKAIERLKFELDLNANKILNPNFRVVSKKGGRVCI